MLEPNASIWSNEMALTDDTGSEKAPSFALDGNGTLLAAFLREDLDTTRHDLLWLERTMGNDLTVGSVAVQTSGTPDQFIISADLWNIGDLEVPNFGLSFYLGDPDAGGILLETTSRWAKRP